MAKEEDLIKCYLCHKPLLQEKVIEGKLQKVLHPERRITQFYLNNSSRMDVTICLSCNKMNLENSIIQDRIMKNIINGWQIEQNILLDRGLINKDNSEKVMNYHRGLSILFKSDSMSDDQIKVRAAK